MRCKGNILLRGEERESKCRREHKVFCATMDNGTHMSTWITINSLLSLQACGSTGSTVQEQPCHAKSRL